MDKNHPKVNFGKTGVLLVNLGTPDTTNWWDIRKYLKEFWSISAFCLEITIISMSKSWICRQAFCRKNIWG